MKRVAVIGAGTMGSGIAQVTAIHGYEVVMVDISQDVLSGGMKSIQSSLSRMEKKGKLTPEQSGGIMGRISPSIRMEEAAEAEIVIEAVPENLELKKQIFQTLDRQCSGEAILGTNTSSLPVTAIAAATRRPERVVGIHFMNPVPVMRGVEVIRGYHTSEDTLQRTLEFLKSIEKIPGVAPDLPGFVTSRILNVYLNEAVNCVMMGARPEDVDNLMVHCCNMPMGPLRLLDLVGLDVHLNVQNFLSSELGDKYQVCPLTRQMVRAGMLGVKTGRGFYTYEKK
jgi:3-hydroxybutyryl-CoA dehydrogenase